MKELSCKACVYFQRREFNTKQKQQIGVCHRNPPMPVYDNEEMSKDHSVTLTVGNYWCGEFAPRETPKKKKPSDLTH